MIRVKYTGLSARYQASIGPGFVVRPEQEVEVPDDLAKKLLLSPSWKEVKCGKVKQGED